MKEQSIYRVLDANLNRAREGLRVMEEVVRFVYETKKLAKQLKALRGKLQQAITKLPSPEKIMFFRDSKGDIGKEINPKTEFKRDSISGLFQANAKRVQEALRVLEEFSKILAGGKAASTHFKAQRFKVYQIEIDFIKAHH